MHVNITRRGRFFLNFITTLVIIKAPHNPELIATIA